MKNFFIHEPFMTDERKDIPNKLYGGSMALIPYSGKHDVGKENKCYLTFVLSFLKLVFD